VQLTAPFVFAAARDQQGGRYFYFRSRPTKTRDLLRVWCLQCSCSHCDAADETPRDTAVNMTAGCGMQRMLPAAEARAELIV